MLLWTLGFIYFLELVFSFFVCIYWGLELLDHMVSLFLIFGAISVVFSIMAAPVFILTSSIQGFWSLHILANFGRFFWLSCWQMWGNISLWLWFALLRWWVMLSTFSCTCWPFGCLLWKNVYSDPMLEFKTLNCHFGNVARNYSLHAKSLSFIFLCLFPFW